MKTGRRASPAIAIAIYVAVLAALAVYRWHLWTYGADTGLFMQVVSDAFGGFRDGPEEGTHFRFHWAPVLATLWPFVAITHSPLALQIAQVVLIAASAIPLFALAKAYVGDRVAAAVATLLLVYPPLLAVAFTEFHEIAFYPVLYFGVFWAANRAKWWPFAACAFAAALVREDTCIVFAIVGVTFVVIGLAARRIRARDPRGLLVGEPREPAVLAVAGLGLTAASLLALAVYYGFVTPRLGGWEPAHFYTYPFATGPTALILALLAHPAYIASIVTFGRFTYLLEAFGPLMFLPFFSRWFGLALPGLAIVLLSSNAITWRMGSHYAAIWIPPLFIALVAVIARWNAAGATRRVRLALRAAFAICAIVLVAFDPLHPLHYLRPAYPIGDDVRRALATIPPNAFVVLHDEWYTQIAATHPNATVFFCPYVDYAVYADDYPNDFFQTQIAPEIARERAIGQMRLVRRFGKVGVYTRTPDRGAVYGRCLTVRPDGFATLHAFLNYDLARERARRVR